MRVRDTGTEIWKRAARLLLVPVLAAPALCLGLLALAAPPALAANPVKAVLYKVEFNGNGSLHVADSDGGGYSLDQNAKWELKPKRLKSGCRE